MSSKLSRRNFLRYSAVGAAGAMLLPSALVAAPQRARRDSANDTITLGCIGLGQQTMFLLRGFLRLPNVRIVAGADVYEIKRQRFEKRIKDHYAEQNQRVDVKTYHNYEDILARPDIDGVIIATPDHWHAIIAIAAARAGKDIYLEKPLTFTIFEGQQLIEAVRANARILQVGSQQRSSPEFLHFADFIRSGKLGKVNRVYAYVGTPAPPQPYTLPAQPVPAGLDWDRWLGPLPGNIHYNERINPPISLDPVQNETYWGEWRYNEGLGGGLMTDWGAHMFDIAQWALGKDRSGPVEIIPPGVGWHEHLTFNYDNGITMTMQSYGQRGQGVKIWGDNGWMTVRRGAVDASDPSFLPPPREERREAFETLPAHYEAFVNSMRSRRDPNCPVEIGHSTCTVCNLGNLATKLNRQLNWNPITETFSDGDAEATKMLHYQYRAPYTL